MSSPIFHRPIPTLLCVTIMVLGVSSACAPKDEAATDTAATDTTAAAPPAATPPAPTVTDPQIAHIAVTANAIDSSFGALAATKARSQAVKDFAQTMVRDHGAVNKQAVALAQRLNVTPEENDVSRQLQTAADQARGTMTGLTGAAFDSAYMAREVTYHQAVIDALDQTLIPNAQNADLKSLLESVRPNFVAHLERARQVQGSLGGRGSN
jgi:putative membrane protein